jgi:phage N-6-adenine-methyltransferase
MANYETKTKTGRSDWGTPQLLFDKLNQEFKFNLDPAATKENAKCENYYTEEEDGLQQPWHTRGLARNKQTGLYYPQQIIKPGRVFCNPPYGSQTKLWVAKAREEVSRGNCEVAVLLLPVRTCTKWFHEHVAGHAELRFIEGRVVFEGADQGAMFPSMLAIYRRRTAWTFATGTAALNNRYSAYQYEKEEAET